jgi:hypothetical protein
METSFYSIVMNYFNYLVTDYSFSVQKVEEGHSSISPEGRIDFETHSSFVTVVSDRGTAGATIGRIVDDKYTYYLNPITIHEYLTFTDFDKKLLYSLDPSESRKAKMILRQARLTHQVDLADPFVDIETQLADYAKWLRQYAEPFLRGDFSQWLEIYEYKVLSARAAYIRSGKEEYVRTVTNDQDKHISIFQTDFDYLNRLRQEYGNR